MCKECEEKIPFIEKCEEKEQWYYVKKYKYKLYYATPAEMTAAYDDFIYPRLEKPEKDLNKTYHIKDMNNNPLFC